LLGIARPAAGQQALLVRSGLDSITPCACQAGPSRVYRYSAGGERRSSTGIERFIWGAMSGFLVAVAADRAWDRSRPASAVGYVLGTAVGVGLVTGAREGLNVRGTAMGILAGTTAGLLLWLGGDALANDADGEATWPEWAGAIGFMVAVPLGASIGHAAIGRSQHP